MKDFSMLESNVIWIEGTNLCLVAFRAVVPDAGASVKASTTFIGDQPCLLNYLFIRNSKGVTAVL